jgi:hypothetical protein
MAALLPPLPLLLLLLVTATASLVLLLVLLFCFVWFCCTETLLSRLLLLVPAVSLKEPARDSTLSLPMGRSSTDTACPTMAHYTWIA